MVRKDCEAGNLQVIHITVQTPTHNSNSILVFTHTHKFSAETTLSVAEIYRQGAESWCMRRRRITINIKCAALCQQGELALDHKDIVQRAMKLWVWRDIWDDDGFRKIHPKMKEWRRQSEGHCLNHTRWKVNCYVIQALSFPRLFSFCTVRRRQIFSSFPDRLSS